MVNKKYIPDKGDICWASLDPTLGHEQKGRRPVLILSPLKYNILSGLVVICPMTSKIKNYPFEVRIGEKGVILSDHIRSISWQERNFKLIMKSSSEIVPEVLNRIRFLLDI